jgi:hypothetical protein
MALAERTNPTKNDIELKQQKEMREWVICRLPEKMLPFLDGVEKIYDRNELILANIKRLGYKDIIMRPEMDEFGDDIIYQAFFKNDTLGKRLGYEKPRNLFDKSKPLENHHKYTLPDLDRTIQTPQNEASEKSIIPEHLNNKLDSNRNTYIYIDIDGAEALIQAALKQSKFKANAMAFRELLSTLNRISTAIISRLSKLVAEFRIQNIERDTRQNVIAEIEDQRQVEALQLEESRQKAIDARRELAIAKFTTNSSPGIIYAKAAPNGSKMICTKIGKTNDPVRRIVGQNNALPVPDAYLIEMDVRDMMQAETLAHRLLDSRNTRVTAKKEFFYITNADAVEFVRFIANSINAAYDNHINPALDRYIEEYAVGDMKFNEIVQDQEQALQDQLVIIKREFIARVIEELMNDGDSIIITKRDVLAKMKDIKNRNEFRTHRMKLQPEISWITEIDGYDITIPAKYSRNDIVIKRV